MPYGLQNRYVALGASWVGSIPTYSRQQILDIVEIQGNECDVNAWSAIGCSPMDSMFFCSLSNGVGEE